MYSIGFRQISLGGFHFTKSALIIQHTPLYRKSSPNTDFSGAFANFLLGNLILPSYHKVALVPVT